jgi:methyl-accepting chemotaxis protein
VLLGIGGLVLLFGVVVGLALFLVVELKEHEAKLNDRDIPFSVSIAEVALDSKAAANDERGFLLTSDKRFLAEFRADTHATREALSDAAAMAPTAAQRTTVLAARRRFDRWAASVGREFAALRSGDRSAAVAAAVGPHRALRKQYEQSIAQAHAHALVVVSTAARKIDKRSNDDIVILVVLLVSTLTIGTAVAIWLVRSVVRPISSLLAIFVREKSA